MFRAELIGNLGADAMVKVENGRKFVQFSVADTRRWKDAEGKTHEETNWVSCFYRNTEAEVIKYLTRGTKVYIRGNLELRLYSSEKERRMKAGATINVNEIELLNVNSDAVPRTLYTADGAAVDIHKYYLVSEGFPNQELRDMRGNVYKTEKGWVSLISGNNSIQLSTNNEGSGEEQKVPVIF